MLVPAGSCMSRESHLSLTSRDMSTYVKLLGSLNCQHIVLSSNAGAAVPCRFYKWIVASGGSRSATWHMARPF
jgi:hypothetical protein